MSFLSAVDQLCQIYGSAPKEQTGKLDANNLFLRMKDGKITLEKRGLGVWWNTRWKATREGQYNLANNLAELERLIKPALQAVYEGRVSHNQAQAVIEISSLYNQLVSKTGTGRWQKYSNRPQRKESPQQTFRCLTAEDFRGAKAQSPQESEAAKVNAWMLGQKPAPAEDTDETVGLRKHIEQLTSPDVQVVRKKYVEAKKRLDDLTTFLKDPTVTDAVRAEFEACRRFLEEPHEGVQTQSLIQPLDKTLEQLEKIEIAVLEALQKGVADRIVVLTKVKEDQTTGPAKRALIESWIQELQLEVQPLQDKDLSATVKGKKFIENAHRLSEALRSHEDRHLEGVEAKDQEAAQALDGQRTQRIALLAPLQEKAKSAAERRILSEWIAELQKLEVTSGNLEKTREPLRKALREYSPEAIPAAVDRMLRDEQAQIQRKIEGKTFGQDSPIMRGLYTRATKKVKNVGLALLAFVSTAAHEAQIQNLSDDNLNDALFTSGCIQLWISAHKALEQNDYLRDVCKARGMYVSESQNKNAREYLNDTLKAIMDDPSLRTYKTMKKIFEMAQKIDQENAERATSISTKNSDDMALVEWNKQYLTIFGGIEERLQILEHFCKLNSGINAGAYSELETEMFHKKEEVEALIKAGKFAEAREVQLVAGRSFREQEFVVLNLMFKSWLQEHGLALEDFEEQFHVNGEEVVIREFLSKNPEERLKTLANVASKHSQTLQSLLERAPLPPPPPPPQKPTE